MTDPKQTTAKVVLNAITYKKINNGEIGIPVPVCIDITDLLKQHNVLPGEVHGVSIYDGVTSELDSQAPGHTAFVISGIEIRQMVDEFFNVIDAAIVNTNQSKASKRLIDNILGSFFNEWWGRIRG